MNTFLLWTRCDAPENWQVTIQDPATPALEGMITFHEYLIFFLIQVGVIVCFFLWENNQRLKAEKFTHESFIEIIWTFLPAIILLFIAVPSFILLYSLDDVLNPTVTIKVVAHQWYWSYEYVDYVTNPMTDPFCGELTFDSYLVSTADIIEGSFRLLEVDQRLVVPTHTHVRLLIFSGDVLHSWAVPATGVKLDACPGRISEVNLFLKRSGVYYSQGSKICGTNHGFMPIVVEAVSPYAFYNWLHSKVMNASISATSLTLPEECLTWSDPVVVQLENLPVEKGDETTVEPAFMEEILEQPLREIHPSLNTLKNRLCRHPYRAENLVRREPRVFGTPNLKDNQPSETDD